MYTTLVQNPIEVRKSTRTFQDTPLTSIDLEKISSYLNNPKNLMGPYGNKIEFELVIETNTQGKKQIGTYGFIQNSQGYIFGGSIKNTQCLFDYAFVLENIVLYLTTLNVGTCWLGGRFKKTTSDEPPLSCRQRDHSCNYTNRLLKR